MKKIKVGDKEILVDDEDFEIVMKYEWRIMDRLKTRKTSYAISTGVNGVFMHRLIMNTPKGMITDHKNGDGLDNRKTNLRICTTSQNLMNRGINKNNSSGYKGVSFYKHGTRKKRWTAYVWLKRKKYRLGYFNTPEEAAIAYNEKAIELHGKFANVNKI